MRRGTGVVLAAAALVGPGLAGCGSAVEATVPRAASDPACARVGAAWPQAVAGQDRVETRSSSTAVAAWGDPAIVARCGVASPGPTTQDCIDASGVDWVVQPLDDGTRFTTYGRTPAVEVLVPAAYAPEPLVLGAFASAAAHVPQGESRCR